VGLEPQITTLTKIRHINHFVKVAPFSNEVNFSEMRDHAKLSLLLLNLNSCLLMLSATDRNYRITALHNYRFTVRLSPKKLENQSLNPIKIETAHREGTLTHIQLPS
jgi:hypothetical protein